MSQLALFLLHVIMFCCFPRRGRSALHDELHALHSDIDRMLRINSDLTTYSEEISRMYTETIAKNIRLRSVVLAQKDDIDALKRIITRPMMDKCTQTTSGDVLN